MKKPRTDSLEYIAQKHKQEQEEYLKVPRDVHRKHVVFPTDVDFYG